MVVFDRYGLEFRHAGYREILPDGIAWGGLTPVAWDPGEPAIDFEGDDPIAGYDPDEFVQLTLVGRGQDPKDDRCFRSHLGKIVTKRLDKIIGLPCLKDHHAAGATGALKNMSHGLVNNASARTPARTARPWWRSSRPWSATRSSARSVSCTSWTGPAASGTAARTARTPSGSGTTTPSCSPPTRWRWTALSGTSSTPAGER